MVLQEGPLTVRRQPVLAVLFCVATRWAKMAPNAMLRFKIKHFASFLAWLGHLVVSSPCKNIQAEQHQLPNFDSPAGGPAMDSGFQWISKHRMEMADPLKSARSNCDAPIHGLLSCWIFLQTIRCLAQTTQVERDNKKALNKAYRETWKHIETK